MAFARVRKEFEDTERLYILEMIVDEVTVYKVGKASGHSSKKRMLQIVESYFDVYRVTPLVKIVKDREVKDVFSKETKCHHELKEWQFTPAKKFSGATELFNIDKEKVLEVYENVLQGIKTD